MPPCPCRFVFIVPGGYSTHIPQKYQIKSIIFNYFLTIAVFCPTKINIRLGYPADLTKFNSYS